MQKNFGTFVVFVIFLLAVSSALSLPALAAVKRLQGSLSIIDNLDKSLPPLDRRLTPKHDFDLDTAAVLLRKEIPQNVWYKIPTWLAGGWEIREVMHDDERDELTGRTYHSTHPYMNITHGGQGYFPTTDQNYWWHFADSNCWNKTEKKRYISWLYFEYIAPINPDKKDGSIKMVSIDFTVDRRSNRIVHVCRRQDVHTYTRLSDDLVQFVNYGREYEIKGKLVASYCLISEMRRMGMPCVHSKSTPSGRNATQLIMAYLQDHDMQDEYDNIIRLTKTSSRSELASTWFLAPRVH